MLAQMQIVSPMFYISAYFEEHKEEYYERLRAVSRDDDWTGWIKFFLRAITSQAKENEKRVRATLDLYESTKETVVNTTHSQYSIATIDFLFSQPFFNSTSFIQKSGIPSATARRILRKLSADGTLQVLREAKGRQIGIYVFPELVNIAEGRKVF